MRRKKNIGLALSIFASLFLALILPRLSNAGSLEPSDPPGPTMYTLEEIFKVVTPLPTGFELWPNNPRFAVSNEGTADVTSDDIVLDRATGLMWTRDANLTGLNNWQNWQGSVNYCDSLEAGRLHTLATDWRLPSIEDLTSLSEPHPSTHSPSLPAGHPFVNVQSDYYWSATSDDPTCTDCAWHVHMYSGYVTQGATYGGGYVWCVRGGH